MTNNVTLARKVQSLAAVAVLTGALTGHGPAQAKLDDWRVEWGQYVAQELTQELTEVCPMADPGDREAFESCQKAVFASAFIEDNMRDYVFWGGIKPNTRIDDLTLTQFNEEIWRGLYLPLFMFTGNMSTEVNEELGRMKLHMEIRFRNTLKPGEYPYPFWHAIEKWNAYQEANDLVFTLDLVDAEIIAIQRSPYGKENADLQIAESAPPRKFVKDEWMWRDDSGKLQPKVTLFDGLYRPENPFLGPMETSYKDFALELRNNTCFVCHVPNNPEKMKNLVLLQTPAHAAGEIGRVIRSVKAGAMPGKSWAGPKGINNPKAKEKFLAFAEAFKTQVDAAAAWEADNAVVK